MYNVELPLSNNQLFYKELTSKQQLTLAKADIMFPIENEDSSDYSKIVKEVISNCIENKEDFYKLNVIEYLLFLTKLRIVSIGNTLELSFQNSEDSSEMAIKITIDLNVFMKLLYEAAEESLKNNIIKFKDIEVKLDWPSIKSEKYFLKNKEDLVDYISSTIPEYIKYIKTKNKKILFENFLHLEKIKLYENLPIKIKDSIQEAVVEMTKKMSEKNLFAIKKMDYLKFSLYNKSHQHIIRLLFSESLRNIYQEYYILASKNINPSYVDNLTISERKVYSSFVEEELKAKNEARSSSNSNSNKNSVDLASLMSEFGE